MGARNPRSTWAGRLAPRSDGWPLGGQSRYFRPGRGCGIAETKRKKCRQLRMRNCGDNYGKGSRVPKAGVS